MEVYDLICELTHFDPHCKVMLQDKSGDVFPISIKDLGWNASDGDTYRDARALSTELYITLDKEIES